MSDGIDLKQLIASGADRTAWVEFKGIHFLVKWLPRAAIQVLAERSSVKSYDRRDKTRTRSLDTDRFAEELAKAMVADWRDCTVRKLGELVLVNAEGMTDEQLDAQVPFTHENLMVLIKNVNELDIFLQECATDPATFKPEDDEELTGNS